MKDETFARDGGGPVSRRAAVRMIGTAAGAATFAPQVLAQQVRPAPAANAARAGAPGVVSRPTEPDSRSRLINIKDFGAICDGVTDDRAALAAAITYINALPNPQGELIIPGSTKIGSNITVPANISLRLPIGGYLAPSSGVTVTVNGQFLAEAYNCIYIGYGGAVSFASNQRMREFIAEWWELPYGATTDAVPMLNAIVAAIPDYSRLEFMWRNVSLTFKQTWRITGRTGLNIRAASLIEELPQVAFQDLAPWTGTRTGYSSGNSVVCLQSCGHCSVQGFGIANDIVNTAIEIVGEGGSRISTNNTVMFNRLYNRRADVNWTGVSIAPSGEQNNEFMIVSRNTIIGSGRKGRGIFAGGGSNNHGHMIEDNNISDLAKGIAAGWTGYTARHNHFTQNALDFEVTHLSYPTVIENNGSEESRQFYKAGASGGESTVEIRNNRLASLGAAGVAWIELGEFIGPTSIIGNDYQNYNKNNSRLYSFPWNGVGNPAITVNLSGNNYANMLNQGMPAANFMVRTGSNAPPARLNINLNGDALPGAR